MNRHFPVFGLLACALLIGVAVLLAVSPVETARPRIPARLDTTPIAHVDNSTGLIGRTMDQADTGPLPVPPPPPAIESGLEPALLWMRVIDAATNRPLANTLCICTTHLEDEDTELAGFVVAPFDRKTDAHGLISFTIIELDDDDEDYPAAPEPGRAKDIHMYAEYGALAMPLPVPAGWYPVCTPEAMFGYAEKVSSGVVSRPLDIFVRRTASVVVTPRDRDGLPLADAEVRLFAVADRDFYDDFRQNWMPEDLEVFFDDDWGELLRECATALNSASVQVWFQGQAMINPDTAEDGEGQTLLDYALGGRGTRRVEGLPLIRIYAVCWHPMHGTGTASIALESGPNALDVNLAGLPGRLEVNVILRGELSRDNYCEPYLFLEQTTLYGTPWDGVAVSFDAAEGTSVSGSSWRFTVAGLVPGFWAVEIVMGDIRGRVVEIRPGEVTSITVYIGSDSGGEWQPVFRADGRELDACPFLLNGGDGGVVGYDRYTAVKYASGWDTFSLPAGSYTAVVPTLPPFHFTIQPGQVRQDVFELKVARVGFSIDTELHSIMMAGEATDDYVALDLYPIGVWHQNYEHLRALHELMFERDNTYDALKPGVASPWLIPFGLYSWTIRQGNDEISGVIDINAASPSLITFSVANLPGVAGLLLEFDGFAGEDGSGIPVFWVQALPDARTGSWYGPHTRTVAPWQKRSDVDSAYLIEDVHGVVDHKGRRVLIVGQPGACIIEVEGEATVGQDDADLGNLTVQANMPGRLRISAASLRPKVPATLVFKNARVDDLEYNAVAFAGGIGGPLDLYFDEANDLYSGRWLIALGRGTWNEKDDTEHWAFAEITANLAPGRNEIDINTLEWIAGGSVVITCRGRGSPDQPIDAWWQQELSGESEAGFPTLLMRLGDDQRPAKVIRLPEPCPLMPGGRLEFAYRLDHLPPGLYRFIPWPGAGEKWCRTFEVIPGAVTTVLVQGG